MKKIFLAALTALALSSYTYAQDDDDYEDSPRAVATSSTAPAKQSIQSEGGDGFIGVSLDLLGLLNNDLQRFGLVFKLAQNMELTAHFGLLIIGDSDGEDQDGKKVNGDEGYAQIALGAGFDFFFNTPILPSSIGGDILFTHLGEDNNSIDFDVMFGVRAEIVKGFTINGKVGFDINYHWWSTGNTDWSRVNFGVATRVNMIWFFL